MSGHPASRSVSSLSGSTTTLESFGSRSPDSGSGGRDRCALEVVDSHLVAALVGADEDVGYARVDGQRYAACEIGTLEHHHDTDAVGGQTCETQGYDAGTLACLPDCTADVCRPVPGCPALLRRAASAWRRARHSYR